MIAFFNTNYNVYVSKNTLLLKHSNFDRKLQRNTRTFMSLYLHGRVRLAHGRFFVSMRTERI